MITLKSLTRLLLLIALVFVPGCDDDDRFDSVRPSAPLIGGIQSYQSLDAFKSSLGSDYAWEMLPNEHSSFSGDKYRPPFMVESLLVRDFVHLGHKGNLLAVFFNDRLAKTLFFPLNPEGYIADLSLEIGSDAISEERFLARPHVQIWVATDHQGQNYVGWEDERLAGEMANWIKKYA